MNEIGNLPEDLLLEILNKLNIYSINPIPWNPDIIEDYPNNNTLIYYDSNNSLHISYKQWLKNNIIFIKLSLVSKLFKNIISQFLNTISNSDLLFYYFIKNINSNYHVNDYSLLVKFYILSNCINLFTINCPVCNKKRNKCNNCLLTIRSVTNSTESFWIPSEFNARLYMINIQINKLLSCHDSNIIKFKNNK